MPTAVHLLLAQAAKSFADNWGNAASVWGFVLSVISLLIALWSACRVKTATREALSKASALVLTGQTTVLMRLIAEARDAAGDGRGPVAIDRYRQARLIMVTLFRHPHLQQTERDALRKAAADLSLLRRSIEKALGAGGAALLSDRDKRILDQMETMFGDIISRLQAGPMEV